MQFTKNDATHLFEKSAPCAEPKTPSVASLREIGIMLKGLDYLCS
jgi:hypothetical protein